jgi:hypothetical protein
LHLWQLAGEGEGFGTSEHHIVAFNHKMVRKLIVAIMLIAYRILVWP